jgi:hypothetical protein
MGPIGAAIAPPARKTSARSPGSHREGELRFSESCPDVVGSQKGGHGSSVREIHGCMDDDALLPGRLGAKSPLVAADTESPMIREVGVDEDSQWIGRRRTRERRPSTWSRAKPLSRDRRRGGHV